MIAGWITPEAARITRGADWGKSDGKIMRIGHRSPWIWPEAKIGVPDIPRGRPDHTKGRRPTQQAKDQKCGQSRRHGARFKGNMARKRRSIRKVAARPSISPHGPDCSFPPSAAGTCCSARAPAIRVESKAGRRSKEQWGHSSSIKQPREQIPTKPICTQRCNSEGAAFGARGTGGHTNTE